MIQALAIRYAGGILVPLHGALLLARFARRDDERGELVEVGAEFHEVVLLVIVSLCS